MELPALHFAGHEPLAFPSLGRVLRDPERHWPEAVLDRSVVRATARGQPVCMVSAPAAIAAMLSDRASNFPRSALHQRILGAGYGDSLIRNAAHDGRQQRRDIADPIAAANAARQAADIGAAVTDMLAEWADAGSDGPLDIVCDSRRLALDALWRCFFGEASDDRHGRALADRASRAIDAADRLPFPDQLALLGPLATLAAARTRPGTDEAQRADDIAMTTLFLHVGHDNVAATLVWALWLLAVHPDIQQRARAEWARRPGDRDARLDAADLPLIGAIVRETLRLYPPIMQLIRDVRADVAVDDDCIRAGSTAVLGLYAMHRHRRWWDAPDAFRPDRFLVADNDSRSRMLWLPFGTGPAGCIGARFAQMELVMTIGMVLDRFELIPRSAPTCQVDFALRPAGRDLIGVRALR